MMRTSPSDSGATPKTDLIPTLRSDHAPTIGLVPSHALSHHARREPHPPTAGHRPDPAIPTSGKKSSQSRRAPFWDRSRTTQGPRPTQGRPRRRHPEEQASRFQDVPSPAPVRPTPRASREEGRTPRPAADKQRGPPHRPRLTPSAHQPYRMSESVAPIRHRWEPDTKLTPRRQRATPRHPMSQGPPGSSET
jgi:hypothetical protein